MGRPRKIKTAPVVNEINTRDPIVTTRDPQLVPRMANVIAIYQPLIRCKCGHGTMRHIDGTKPNYSTGQMARRKQCAKCGQKYCVFTEPTEVELAKYWKE